MAADFGLPKIAKLLGKEDAFAKFMEAAATEEAGDYKGSIELYKKAFKMWDALDSVTDEGGLPVAVRREAEAAGIDCDVSTEVIMDTQESPCFNANAPAEWLPYLEENGYCVLTGVADGQAVALANSLMWDFLESVPDSQVKRGDSATWDTGWLPNASNGILGVHGFGQSSFCWHARLLPKVRQAFETIWKCKDVIASFDGGNAFRPWLHKPEWRTAGGWWHVDQNPFLRDQDGLRCVQGLVSFTDATPTTGGLCVIPGSHRYHKDVCTRAYAHISSGHYVQVQPCDPVLELGAKLVCAKAGDLVLWDSRCVHCNTPGSFSHSEACDSASAPDSELLRVVAYVCMTPASWASPDVLAQRKQGFLNNETTDHLPHEWHGTGQTLSWPPPNIWEDASFAQKRLIVGASTALLEQAHRVTLNEVAVKSKTTSPPELEQEATYESKVKAEPSQAIDLHGLGRLNTYLMQHSYLGGTDHVTAEDYDRCRGIQASDIDFKRFPHVARWHSHVQYLMARWGLFDLWGNPLPADGR